MATGDAVQELREEATCPICLEYFEDPVIIPGCGHNFCRACLAQCWGEAAAEASCPQCRGTAQPRNLLPNWQLANMVEIAKKLSPPREREREAKAVEGPGRTCGKHQEPLKLFCKDDKALICVICDRSKEHRHHNVVPVEEAAQEYQVQIGSCLENLRKEREKILAHKTEAEKESEDLLKRTEAEKQEMVAEFRGLRQFLEEQENTLLAQMKGVEEEIVKKREEHLTRISEELSSLDDFIQELEKKCQQIASEVLQDVTSTLQRYEQKKFENPFAFPPALKSKVWGFCAINLKNIMKKLKGTLLDESQLHKENVTLDPDSAHPQLLISKDRKCLTLGDRQQLLPNDYQRFSEWHCVRGKGSLKSQMRYWDVEVGNEEGWAVGICLSHTVLYSEEFLGPDTGVWAIGKWSGEYRVVRYPYNPSLSLSGEPNKIRVLLNFPMEEVSFYDADTAALLHIFSIQGYTEFQPFFWLFKKSHLRICP